MSLNIIVNIDITETAKELLKLIAEEEKRNFGRIDGNNNN